IETQAELLERLRAEGFVATQATVSRDIAELGLVKVRGASGKSYYTRPPQPPASEVLERTRWALREYVVGIEFSGRLVLLKTLSGRAHAAAAAIDEYNPPGVLGTVAGDDSVLILVRPREPAPPAPEVQEVLRLLQQLRGSSNRAGAAAAAVGRGRRLRGRSGRLCQPRCGEVTAHAGGAPHPRFRLDRSTAHRVCARLQRANRRNRSRQVHR